MKRGLVAALCLGLGCRSRPPAAPAQPVAARPGPAVTAPARDPLALAPQGFRAGWSAAAEGVRWRGTTVALAPAAPSIVSPDPRSLAWLTVRLDLGRVRFSVHRPAADRLEALGAEAGLRAAFNAGFFEPDRSPSGILSAGATIFGAPTPRGGTGVMVIDRGRARLVNIARDAGVAEAPAGVELAVQCTPRLIEADGSRGITRDDGRRASRLVLCLRDGGATLDVIAVWDPTAPLRGPGLYWLSGALLGPSPTGDPTGCEAALNLDGGPSTALFVRDVRGVGVLHPAEGPTPWVIGVSARAE